MPRLKADRQAQKMQELQALIEYKAKLKGVTAESMARVMGCSEQTVRLRRKDPSKYTLAELVGLSERLGGLDFTL